MHSTASLAKDGMQVRTHAHIAGQGTAETGQFLIQL